MSTKTTFKRVALVAVAALGLGVLSVAPSQATVSAITVTGVNGTSTNSGDAYVSDSTTAATLTVSALLDTAGDTLTVTFLEKSKPTGADATAYSYFMDTTTPSASTTQVDTVSATSTTAFTTMTPKMAGASGVLGNGTAKVIGTTFRVTHGSNGYVGAKFAIQLDSSTARTVAGTYTYTAVIKSYNSGTLSTTTTTQDISVVVPAAATASTTVAPASTTAYINAGSYTSASDSSVAVVATAATTTHATIRVRTYNAAGSDAPESITATLTGPGLICDGSTCGKNLVVAGDGNTDLTVRADGNAGVATINVKTTSVTFSPKTVTFYAKSPKTITASVNKPVISTGSTNNSDVILAKAVDADGNAWTGSLYVLASSASDALIAGSATTPVGCTYTASISAHVCPVSGTLDGTAKFKVVDMSLDVDGTWAAADAAATSNEVSVRVSTAAPASVKLAFKKSTYAPGEQAEIWAIVTDAAGNALPEKAITNLFATGGIVSNVALTAVSDTTLSSTSGTVKGATSTTDPKNPTNAGAVTFVVNMPQASGEVVLTATGGAGLALAGRVAVTATATVVNSSVDAATDAANEATDAANAATDAALAAADAADAATAAAQDASDAVAALSAEVSKMIASLKAQITSLTNLVIKIQKKVKA
jgi:hypothetical protein